MNRFFRISEAFERYSGWIILAAVAITLLLIIPLLTMGTDEDASGEPGGQVFDLRDDINDRFPPRTHGAFFLVESRTGDVPTQNVLWELYQNEKILRQADEKGELNPDRLDAQPYLYQGFDADLDRPIVGIYTMADAVQDVLIKDPRLGTTLEAANDDQVKLAVHQLLTNPATSEFRNSLSVKGDSVRREVSGREIDYWTSPALTFGVAADNDKLGGGGLEIGVQSGETVRNKEEFNRNLQSLLRGNQKSFRLWGIAIDASLESEDEGTTAGVFIVLTVVGVLIVVGISLRSYWAVALTGAGLGILMIWLKGISNLIGLEGGLVIDLIVPIAMISLGVDFAVHALRRYNEEKGLGYDARRAYHIGLAGVAGALVLAMLSDSIAFLSNVASGIDSIINFGVAAAIAVFSSFVVLGGVLPLVMMRLDRVRRPTTSPSSWNVRVLTFLATVGASIFSAAGIILLVAVDKAAGAAVILLCIVITIAVPLAFMLWRKSHRELPEVPAAVASMSPSPEGGAVWLVSLIAGFARYRLAVLPVIAILTILAVFYALRLDASFDVEDFFNSSSDFVVGLDKVDEHVGETSGEPATVYIRGDLTDPQALASIQLFLNKLSDNESVGKRADGDVDVQRRTVFSLLRRLTSSGYARSQAATVTGVEIEDANRDGIPDSKAQIKAAYDYMTQHGVPLDEGIFVYDTGQVRETLYHDPRGVEDDVTTFTVGIPGTRQQERVRAAEKALGEDLKVLDQSPSITFYGLTGSPFTRQAVLDATTRSLQRSLPIAAVATLVLLIVTMRSIGYAIVTIIPVGLVVAWLYAIMYLTGFSLNFVTATIGAVSIGVGIDYSIHMTERFREELGRASDRMQALRQAARGTGVALLASAASSIVGFAIMGFAPMPMFSSYGILTAIMIFLALSAPLLVLPSLLLLVTPDKAKEGA